jgi:hypothetical protein
MNASDDINHIEDGRGIFELGTNLDTGGCEAAPIGSRS